jgi:CBS-domain-containing membrane protein
MLIRDLTLADAFVPHTATFGEAARELAAHEVDAIAVVDDERRVVGLFTSDDLLTGMFPRYLGDLRHTAFLRDDSAAVDAQVSSARSDPVTSHMSEPTTIDAGAGLAHIAERFLHCRWAAIAVVDQGRFVGMLGQVEFCRHLLQLSER